MGRKNRRDRSWYYADDDISQLSPRAVANELDIEKIKELQEAENNGS